MQAHRHAKGVCFKRSVASYQKVTYRVSQLSGNFSRMGVDGMRGRRNAAGYGTAYSGITASIVGIEICIPAYRLHRYINIRLPVSLARWSELNGRTLSHNKTVPLKREVKQLWYFNLSVPCGQIHTCKRSIVGCQILRSHMRNLPARRLHQLSYNHLQGAAFGRSLFRSILDP